MAITFTRQELTDETLFQRLMTKVTDEINRHDQRIAVQENKPVTYDYKKISQELSANGSAPLQITNLVGTTASGQTPYIKRFTAVPSGGDLQNLKDGQLISVNTGSGDTFYVVTGGNPNTLSSLSVTGSGVPTTRHINTTAPITGGGDLSADRTIAHATTAVVAGSYTSADLTVDSMGHVTAVANGGAAAVWPASIEVAPPAAGWSSYNLGTDTVAVNADGTITMVGTTNGASRQFAYLRTSPATPYTITAHLSFADVSSNATGSVRAGLCWLNNSTDACFQWVVDEASGAPLFIQYGAFKTMGTGGVSGSANLTGDVTLRLGRDFWFRIVDDGVNKQCWWSPNGEDNAWFQFDSRARGIVADTHVAICLGWTSTKGSPYKQTLTLLSWKQT